MINPKLYKWLPILHILKSNSIIYELILNLRCPGQIPRSNLSLQHAAGMVHLMQDFRHLLVFDFRQEFEQTHIRDAFHVHPGLNRGLILVYIDSVMDIIDLAERKAAEKEQKYKNIKAIRRYFFLGSEKLEANNEGMAFVLKCLSERASKEDKFYSLN